MGALVNGIRNFFRAIQNLGIDALGAIAMVLMRILRLEIYKSSLLSDRVLAEMGAFVLLLAVQFAMDMWAWSRVWMYALPTSAIWPYVLALVFAVVILLLDRSIIVQDTSNSVTKIVPIIGRATFLLLIACVTAIAVELSVFHSEIDKRINNREKIAIDAIRASALDKERTTMAARISGAENREAKERASYENERAQARQNLVSQLERQRKTMEKALEEKRTQVAEESAGLVSGRYGQGPAYRAMKEQEERMALELKEFNHQAIDVLNSFDQQARTGLKINGNVEQERTADQLRNDERAIAEHVREMTPEELSSKYGGDWKQSRGFIDRYRELESMREENATVSQIVWGCRLIMILLGLAILFLKLMSSEEFCTYYSLRAQAAYGEHQGAKDTAKVLGYVNDQQGRSALGWSKAMLFLDQQVSEARYQFVACVLGFQKAAIGLCQPNASGRSVPRHVIINRLRQLWEADVLPAQVEMVRSEDEMERSGGKPVNWPPNLPIKDPRQVAQDRDPWEFTDEELASMGWRDPQLVEDSVRIARRKIREIWPELYDVIAVMEQFTTRELVQRPGSRLDEVSDLRRQFFNEQILPKLHAVEALMADIMEAGEQPPAWPAELANDFVRRNLWRITEEKLRARSGKVKAAEDDFSEGN